MQHANTILLVLAVLTASAAACGVGHSAAGANPSAVASTLVATLLALLAAFAALSPADGATVEGFDSGPHSRHHFSPLSYRMSHHYDGKRLSSGCPDRWRHRPCGRPYYHPSRLSVVQGHNAPEKPRPSKFKHGKETPTVDGKRGSPRSMFMFAYNQCHPECCPSTYSCDRGCVCTTPRQRRWLARRGNNHG